MELLSDVVQSFGEIRYIVSVQDSLTPSPSFCLVWVFLIYVRFNHHRWGLWGIGVRHFYVLRGDAGHI